MSVVCGQLERYPIDRTGHTITNPKLLVEVLSPSTAEYDRGEKVRHQQLLPSLEAIALVDHESQRVELLQRVGAEWTRTESTDQIVIESISCMLSSPRSIAIRYRPRSTGYLRLRWACRLVARATTDFPQNAQPINSKSQTRARPRGSTLRE